MEQTDLAQNFKTKQRFRLSDKQVPEGSSCPKNIQQLLNSTPYMLVMSTLTIYSILAFDIEKGFFDQSSSQSFSIIHCISIGLFLTQIILTSIVERKYIFDFYFWIDIFSTLMMLLELIWIEDLLDEVQNIQVAVTFTKVSKASRFSKIGARSTRIIKLIRLLKIVKLFNKSKVKNQDNEKVSEEEQSNSQQKGQCKDNNHDVQTIQSEENAINRISIIKLERPNVDPVVQKQLQMKWQIQSEQLKKKNQSKNKEKRKEGSKIGEILQYVIQKNIVIMVMGLLLIVPLLSASTWFNKTAQMQPSTSIYLSIIENETNQTVIAQWLDIFIHISLNSSRPLTYFQYQNYTSQQLVSLNTNSIVSSLRQSQKIESNSSQYSAVFSKKKEIQINSWISIGRNFLIVFLLVFTSIVFMKDLQYYALRPLEKMNVTVLKIQKNPFSVMSENQEEEEEEEQDLVSENKDEQEQQLQTNILKNVFVKISSLLALGVGQAPFDYNSANEQGNLKSNTDLLQSSNTSLVEGIFMCLHLGNINEVVQYQREKSLQTIDSILEIFHQTVITNGGYIFDQDEQSSLVCWKLNSQQQAVASKNFASNEKKKAELAFLALVRFFQRVKQYFQAKQNEDEENEPFTKFKFHIGIHQGLAFCGSVGSEVKLSFKSMGQDVLITKFLCKMGKQNGLQNVISANFMKLIPFAHPIIAKIQEYEYKAHDKIKKITLETYSICIDSQIRWDIKTQTIIQSNSHYRNSLHLSRQQGVKKIFGIREELMKSHSRVKSEQIGQFVKSYLKKNPQVEEFLEIWRQTLAFYEQGQWNSAKVGLKNLKDSQFKAFNTLICTRYSQLETNDEPPPSWRIKKVPFIF